MLFRSLLTAAFLVAFAGTSQAAVKSYDASPENGTPGDNRAITIRVCPPITTQPASLFGFNIIDDGGAGTVTLLEANQQDKRLVDLGPDRLTPIFGPGAFIFIDFALTRKTPVGNVSNTSGVGGHGPSGTAPGETVEWGVVSGWEITGFAFCVSSPVTICNQNGFSHGATIGQILPSETYDLGTWNFDAIGDMEAATWYLGRTSNGGLLNFQALPRGAFHGASLPALPLVGFGALAVSLAVIGGRALMNKK